MTFSKFSSVFELFLSLTVILYSPAPVSRAEILSANALFSSGFRLAFSCVLMFKFLLVTMFIVRFLSAFVVFISLKFALNSSPFKR